MNRELVLRSSRASVAEKADSRGRLTGIDGARALAVIGMMAVHVGPEHIDTVGGQTYALAHGRASLLFVFLAGIGVSLLSARQASSSDTRLRLASFALMLLPLGLVLQEFGHPVAVILHHYAAYFLLAMLVLDVSGRRLLALAATATMIGPLFYLSVGTLQPWILDRETASITDGPLHVVSALFISGPYPVLVWCAPLFWGMWVGRLDLRLHRIRLALCVVGAAAAVAASGLSLLLTAIFGVPATEVDWRQLLLDRPHGQMPLWLANGIGAAVFVTGAALILAERFRPAFKPLEAMGRLALTTYVVHVLALQLWPGLLRHDSLAPAVAAVALMAASGMLFATVWLRSHERGPLEALMRMPWQLICMTLGPATGDESGPHVARANREVALVGQAHERVVGWNRRGGTGRGSD